MFLQLLFLVAVWCGVYVLREQALAISAFYKKAEEKRAFESALDGKWQLTRVPEVTLELYGKRFRFSRDGKVFFDGEYARTDSELSFWLLSGTGFAGFWAVQFNRNGEDLAIGETVRGVSQEFVRVALVKALGPESGNRAFAEEKLLRFRRIDR